jgi:hypothetical protein
MDKIIHVMAPIFKSDMDELKLLGKHLTTKDALTDAVELALAHYRKEQIVKKPEI